MSRFRVTAILCALLIGACAKPSSNTPTTGTAGAPDAPTPRALGVPAGEFLEDGALGVVGSKSGDAMQVSSLVVGSTGTDEQLVIGFAKADGLPATAVGPSVVELRRGEGLVRVHLPPDVVSTAIADNVFATFLAQNAYVVRAAGGDSMYVDLHLRSPALARVRATESPALIIVELKSGGPPLPPPAAARANIVVIQPRAGRGVLPLQIIGYARTHEANVIAEMRRDGRAVNRAQGTAADWVSTWGEYRLHIDSAPGTGRAELFVGEHSAKDGSALGVTVSLELP